MTFPAGLMRSHTRPPAASSGQRQGMMSPRKKRGPPGQHTLEKRTFENILKLQQRRELLSHDLSEAHPVYDPCQAASRLEAQRNIRTRFQARRWVVGFALSCAGAGAHLPHEKQRGAAPALAQDSSRMWRLKVKRRRSTKLMGFYRPLVGLASPDPHGHIGAASAAQQLLLHSCARRASPFMRTRRPPHPRTPGPKPAEGPAAAAAAARQLLNHLVPASTRH